MKVVYTPSLSFPSQSEWQWNSKFGKSYLSRGRSLLTSQLLLISQTPTPKLLSFQISSSLFFAINKAWQERVESNVQKFEDLELQVLRTPCTSLVDTEKFPYSRPDAIRPTTDHPGKHHPPILESCRFGEKEDWLTGKTATVQLADKHLSSQKEKLLLQRCHFQQQGYLNHLCETNKRNG